MRSTISYPYGISFFKYNKYILLHSLFFHFSKLFQRFILSFSFHQKKYSFFPFVKIVSKIQIERNKRISIHYSLFIKYVIKLSYFSITYLFHIRLLIPFHKKDSLFYLFWKLFSQKKKGEFIFKNSLQNGK